MIKGALPYKNNMIGCIKKQKEVKLVEYEASGVIKSSLSETMQELGLSPLITNELSEIYAWNIDFFRNKPCDNRLETSQTYCMYDVRFVIFNLFVHRRIDKK